MSLKKNYSVRCLSVITLFVLANSIAGCTTNAKISLDRVESKPNQPISAVILLTEIEGAQMSSGSEVHFNEQRGLYDRKAGWIRGVTQVGDSVEIRLSDVDKVLVRRAGINGPQTIMVKARSLKQSRKWRNWGVLHGRSVKRGDLVKFNHKGAKYDEERRFIVGRTINDALVEIEIDDVLLIQERKFSVSKTIGLAGLVGAGVAAAVGIYWAITFRPISLGG